MVAIMLETDDLNFSAIQKYASGLLSLMMDKFSSALHSKWNQFYTLTTGLDFNGLTMKSVTHSCCLFFYNFLINKITSLIEQFHLRSMGCFCPCLAWGHYSTYIYVQNMFTVMSISYTVFPPAVLTKKNQTVLFYIKPWQQELTFTL